MKGKATCRITLIFCLFFVPLQLLAQKPISFIYHHSLIFLRVKVNEKKDLLFLMDTGANMSSLDRSTSELLKLPLIKEDSVVGTAGTEAIRLCKTKTLQVGNIIVKGMNVNCRDLSKIVAPGVQKVNGILGTDFLKQYAITIDYGKKTITFVKAKTKSTREKIVHFEMISGIPRFEARVNDTITTHLYFNSGVSLLRSPDVYINVSPKQWSAIKNQDRFLTPYTNMEGDGVGGRVKLPVVKIRSVHLNGLEVVKPSIVIQPREGYFKSDNAIGFFGNNLLEKYRKVTIDFLSNRVVMHTINKKVQTHTINKHLAMESKRR